MKRYVLPGSYLFDFTANKSAVDVGEAFHRPEASIHQSERKILFVTCDVRSAINSVRHTAGSSTGICPKAGPLKRFQRLSVKARHLEELLLVGYACSRQSWNIDALHNRMNKSSPKRESRPAVPCRTADRLSLGRHQ